MRQYLHQEPSEDVDEFAGQAGLALALEDRHMQVMAAAVAKAFNGGKS